MFQRKHLKNRLVVLFFLLLPLFVFGACVIPKPRELWWAIDYQLGLPQTSLLSTPQAVLRGCEVFLQEINSKKITSWVKWELISLHGGFHRVLDRDTCGGILKLRNGFITWVSTQVPAEVLQQEIQENLLQLWQFNDFLKSQDIPLVYINCPVKIHKADTQLPQGVSDASNAISDYGLTLMREKEIDCFDAREIFMNNPNEHYRLFFRGDHHWKPEYAFVTFQHLVPIFAKYGIEIPPEVSKTESYDSHGTCEEFSYRLQSQTRQVGYCYCDLKEDTVRWHYLPKFPTDLTVTLPEKNLEQRGAFQQCEGLSNYWVNWRHSVNHRVAHTKVLFIKDSFGLPLFDFFALAFHEVDMIDLRFFDRPLIDYVKETKPDIVVILHEANVFTHDSHMKFITPVSVSSHQENEK